MFLHSSGTLILASTVRGQAFLLLMCVYIILADCVHKRSCKVLRVTPWPFFRAAVVFSFYLATSKHNAEQKNRTHGKMCFDSSNLFPGAVLSKYYPHILNSVAGDRFEGRQKQRLPVCKISKGQNNGKHLGVCWKWRGCWRRCHRRDAASRAAIPPDYRPK